MTVTVINRTVTIVVPARREEEKRCTVSVCFDLHICEVEVLRTPRVDIWRMKCGCDGLVHVLRTGEKPPTDNDKSLFTINAYTRYIIEHNGRNSRRRIVISLELMSALMGSTAFYTGSLVT